MVGSQVVVGDIAVVPYGRGTHMKGFAWGVRETLRNQIFLDENRYRMFCTQPGCCLWEGLCFAGPWRGPLYDPKTGKSHWEDAFPRASSSYYASPTVAGDFLYAPREDGVILIADISKGFKFLGDFDMGERVIASPVPINDKILIRGEKNLLCFSKKI